MEYEQLKFYIELDFENNNDTKIVYQKAQEFVEKIRDELLEYEYYGYEISKENNKWVIAIIYNQLTHREVLGLALSLKISVNPETIEQIAQSVFGENVFVDTGMRYGKDTTEESQFVDSVDPEAAQIFDELSNEDIVEGDANTYTIYSDISEKVIGSNENWQNVVKIPEEFKTENSKAKLDELQVCSISELLSNFFVEDGQDDNNNQLYKSLANNKKYTLGQIISLARLTDEEKSVLLNNIE